MKTRIFVVVHHRWFERSLGTLISTESDMELCGHAHTRAEALRRIIELKPDVAVVDHSLSDGSGLDLIRAIKQQMPAVARVVVSLRDVREEALRAGATTYVCKADPPASLLAAIRISSQPSEVLPATAKQLRRGYQLADGRTQGLSEAEAKLMKLIAAGRSNDEIAILLGISSTAVETCRTKLKRKLHVSTAVDFVRLCVLSRGLLASSSLAAGYPIVLEAIDALSLAAA